MPRMICQYTGVAFESPNKRQKNHPRISELLNEANDNGTYQVVKQRLAEAREQGLTDIEQIIAFARTGARERVEEQAAQRRLQREAQAAREERWRQAREARARVNAILRPAGYRWEREVLDEEALDAFGANAFGERYGSASQVVEWTLLDPAGQPTTVRAALEALAATGNSEAQAWLQAHPRQEQPRA